VIDSQKNPHRGFFVANQSPRRKPGSRSGARRKIRIADFRRESITPAKGGVQFSALPHAVEMLRVSPCGEALSQSK